MGGAFLLLTHKVLTTLLSRCDSSLKIEIVILQVLDNFMVSIHLNYVLSLLTYELLQAAEVATQRGGAVDMRAEASGQP